MGRESTAGWSSDIVAVDARRMAAVPGTVRTSPSLRHPRARAQQQCSKCPTSHHPRQQEPLEAHTNSQSNNANIEMKVFGFMDTASPLGPTWEKACQGRAPTVDASTGMLMGKWAECLAWAVAYEAQHPDRTSTGDVIEARAALSYPKLNAQTLHPHFSAL